MDKRFDRVWLRNYFCIGQNKTELARKGLCMKKHEEDFSTFLYYICLQNRIEYEPVFFGHLLKRSSLSRFV